MNKFFLYTCRHGDDTILVEHSWEAWLYLLRSMELCNGMDLQEILDEGLDVDGDFVQGYLNVDDGGHIETISPTEIN